MKWMNYEELNSNITSAQALPHALRCRSQSSHPTSVGTWCGPTALGAEPADEHTTVAVRNLELWRMFRDSCGIPAVQRGSELGI